MNGLRWIRHRGCWSSGYDSWDYMLVNVRETDDSIEEIVNELYNSNHWSEHWRGAKFEYIELPPLQYLQGKLNHYREKLQHAAEMVEYLKDAVNNYPVDQ